MVNHIIDNSKRISSIEGLLKYLSEAGHESPFRMSSFCFTATNDIATHIQKLKHAIILEAENGESAKYKELKEDKYYLPEDWLNYGAVGVKWYKKLEESSKQTNKFYHLALKELVEAGMSKKRAKESARYFKMYNSQINTVNKFSFAGVMTFYNKRHNKVKGSEFAQNEISDIVFQMVEEIKNIPNNPFKYSLLAYGIK